MKRRLLLHITALALLAFSRPGLAQRARSACDVCHSETEFLRQNASSPEKAAAVHVSDAQIAGSAHAKLQCSSCHESFGKFPHKTGATKSCASCHAQQADQWTKGVHNKGTKEGAQCSSCHTTHDVRTAAQVESRTGLVEMNANCVSCHQTQKLPGTNPHTNKVLCAGCHAPHETQPASDRSSRLWANQQLQTCGTCHRKIAAEWSDGDVHAQALLTRRPQKKNPASAFRAPACTDCHGAHGMLAADSTLEAAGFERCAECHTKTRGPYEDSYHGQAKELGSKKAASCADCHSAHSIRPASDPKSTVAKANLQQTCGNCHKGVTASFTTFDPHVDPHDKSNPLVYWVYKFMSMLLFGTMAFFGLHSLLWLNRLAMDGLKNRRKP